MKNLEIEIKLKKWKIQHSRSRRKEIINKKANFIFEICFFILKIIRLIAINYITTFNKNTIKTNLNIITKWLRKYYKNITKLY